MKSVRKMAGLLLVGFLLLTGLLALAKAEVAYGSDIACGTTITANTTLTHDLVCASAPGLTIGASNITLDGAGYKLIGPGFGNGVVIPYGSSVQGVTVKNLTLTGWGAVGSLDAAINISGSYPSSPGNHTIQNNTITGSARGIWLIYTNGNTLSGNTITSSYYNGIQGVFTTNNNTISGNVISSTTNGSGISIGGSGNVITGNTINSNSDRGMYLSGCTGLTVANNTVSSNGVFGIELNGCSNSTLSGNATSSNAQDGIYLFGGSSNNTVNGNASTNNQGSGIVLWADANNNTITNNTASNNGLYTRYGIYLVGSHNNTIDGNTTNSNTGSGIRLWASNNNSIKNNNIGFNGLAGFLFTVVSSSGNTIYHNNITSNGTPQAQDLNPTLNNWHEPTLLEGNYWSDYTGLDNGSGLGKHAIAGDGIGDTLIPHPPGYDSYPFINPSGWEIVIPVANAGPDQTVNEGILVTLDGTGSTGQNLTFSWTQLAGPVVTLSGANTPTPSFTPLLPGGFGSQVLTFQLTVTSGDLASSDTVDITVKNVNHGPVALAGADQTVNEGSLVTLDGSASYDPDSDPITYQWVQTGGDPVTLNGPTTATPTFTAPILSGGVGGSSTLTFALTVSDDALSSPADEVQVVVEQVNHAPVANAGAPQTVHSGSLVTLDGTGSYDPDSDPITYQWVQTGGDPVVTLTGATTPTPSFVAPPVSGTTSLIFELTVSDTLFSSTAAVSITVKNGPPVCGVASAVPSLLWPPNHGLVPVSISGVTDPDDSGVAISIVGVTQDEPVNGLGDGDTSPDAVIKGDKVLLRAERSGTGNGRVYEVRFTADDGQGGACSGAVSVKVPHSNKRGVVTIDDGQLYDSTQP